MGDASFDEVERRVVAVISLFALDQHTVSERRAAHDERLEAGGLSCAHAEQSTSKRSAVMPACLTERRESIELGRVRAPAASSNPDLIRPSSRLASSAVSSRRWAARSKGDSWPAVLAQEPDGSTRPRPDVCERLPPGRRHRVERGSQPALHRHRVAASVSVQEIRRNDLLASKDFCGRAKLE